MKNPSMRILFVNERLGEFGGVEQNVADVAAALRGRGHTCFLAFGISTGRNERTYADSFDACFECKDAAPLGQSGTGDSFMKVMEKCSPDVIYLHKLPRASMCHAWLGEVRIVRMVHDHELCCPRGWKGYALSGRVCRHKLGWRCWADMAFLKRAPTGSVRIDLARVGNTRREMEANMPLDAFIVGSRFMQDELVQNGFPAGRIQIIPPVVPSRGGSPRPIPHNNRILYVGQLIKGKGVDLLLKALADLACPFSATLVGTGNGQARLEQLAQELRLDDKVEFRGWVDNNTLGPLYQSAQVVVMPSRGPESFGMVGLEAMRQGRPVVAFAAGGITDWLVDGETGFLIAQQDTAAFARALERLLTNRELAEEMGKRGREHVRRQFSFEAYIDRLEALLAGREASDDGDAK